MHFGKSVRLKTYIHTKRSVKHRFESGFFCLEKISMNAIFRIFSTKITKALNVRENKIKNVSRPDWGI